MSEFTEWESFYLIVGGSAGALIGLQFVVMALIAERPLLHVAEGGAAFITPTIVHFGAVLLLSALVRVPNDHLARRSLGAYGIWRRCLFADRRKAIEEAIHIPAWL